MATVEITKEQADALLKDRYGFFGEKNFKGSYNGGKYIANKGKKYWLCDRLSEAGKIMG